MYNRRSFIQVSAAASSAALLAGSLSALAAAAPRIDFYKVVFDRDHPASVAFGRAMAGSGLAAQAIGRDVTALWYEDLYHRWRRGPAAIAGMTPAPVAFCLQMLAQESGMRLAFRAEHVAGADGRLAHRLTGPPSVLDRAALLDKGSQWPRGAAQLVRDCPADFAVKSTLALSSAAASGFAIREPLVSWVLAPPSRA
jgi:hypothetical protein